VPVLLWLDFAGVAVFAATGALAASRKQLDLIGFVFLAAITGMGGGTVRDAVLGQLPVFWVDDPRYIMVAAAIAIVIYFSAHFIESRYKALLWLDAAGLGLFAAMGAARGLEATGSLTVSLVTAMLTATFGGILRDVLAGEPSVILRPEIYVAAALAGGAVYSLASLAGLPIVLSAGLAFVTAFGLRGCALHYGWSLPVYKARAGRDPADL
jgi:uncharacterized membrane protein YeiH